MHNGWARRKCSTSFSLIVDSLYDIEQHLDQFMFDFNKNKKTCSTFLHAQYNIVLLNF